MNQEKRKNKIVIISIVIIAILIILIIGGVILFTDLFKSDKQLFFKYTAEMFESNSSNSQALTKMGEYYEKLLSTPSTNKGTITMKKDNPKDDEIVKVANELSIDFEGKVDLNNILVEEAIILNYPEDNDWEFNIRAIDNQVGYQTDGVSGKYIVDDLEKIIDTETLNNIRTDENIDTSWIDDLKEHLATTYLPVINKHLTDDKFTYVKEEDLTGYKLTLTEEDLTTLLTEIMETLKNDQTTLDKVNENLSLNLTAENIQSILDSLQKNNSYSETNKENKIEITIYTQNGKSNKIKLALNETEAIIVFEEETNEDAVGVKLEMSTTEVTVGAVIMLEGIPNMENVNETYQLEIKYNEIGAVYTWENNVVFTDSIDVEKFDNNNSLILSDLDDEKADQFSVNVSKRMNEIHSKIMESLEMEIDPFQEWFNLLYVGTTTNISNSISDEDMLEIERKYSIYDD